MTERKTGRGPAPARHIPWPEIFKHHISVVEGHLKMIDMVRKHTVEGSGNWHTIMGCVDRAQEMLQASKHVSRTFVPSPDQREQVPLGSSSASMYPGYSPADREQGKAAEEFGRYAAEARVKGTEFKHPDAAYEIGQSNIMKRGTPSRMGQARAAKEKGPRGGSGSGSGSEGPAKQEAKEHATTNGHARKAQVKKPPSEGDNPYFVIDTNPTPINLPGMPAQHIKRSASTPILVEGNEHKKAKKRHDGELPKGDDVGNGKTEDISEVVNARMKEKEEKRRHREEKKRKRESVGEFSAATEGSGAADVSAAAPTEVDKPKKKKAKKSDDKDLAARTVSKERTGEDEGVAEEGEGKKKKKRKKGKWIAEEV